MSAAYTVTVNQASGQADPVRLAPINFTVVFSRAVGSSSFTTADIVQNGTATGVTWSLSSTDNITWTLAATAVGASGTVIPSIAANSVTDTFGNNNAASTSSDNTVTYDVTVPTLAFVALTPGNPGNSLTPTILGTASKTSTVTLFYDSGCTSQKSSAASNAVFASPGIPLTSNVASNSTTVIYGRAVDSLGNTSICTELVTYTHDGVAPAVTGVNSSLASGNYKAGQVVPVQVAFSKVVNVTGTPQIALTTGASTTTVNYASGTGTNTLTFNYTVFAGDNTAKLDYAAEMPWVTLHH
jgi:hypothetical protein